MTTRGGIRVVVGCWAAQCELPCPGSPVVAGAGVERPCHGGARLLNLKIAPGCWPAGPRLPPCCRGRGSSEWRRPRRAAAASVVRLRGMRASATAPRCAARRRAREPFRVCAVDVGVSLPLRGPAGRLVLAGGHGALPRARVHRLLVPPEVAVPPEVLAAARLRARHEPLVAAARPAARPPRRLARLLSATAGHRSVGSGPSPPRIPLVSFFSVPLGVAGLVRPSGGECVGRHAGQDGRGVWSSW